MMDPQRMNDLLAAQACFARQERLRRRPAEGGVYLIGPVTCQNSPHWEVVWGSPAFDAGLTSGSLIHTVNGEPFDFHRLGDAITAAINGDGVKLGVATRSYNREVILDYTHGHRFPYLNRLSDIRPRLDEIFTARLNDIAAADGSYPVGC